MKKMKKIKNKKTEKIYIKDFIFDIKKKKFY